MTDPLLDRGSADAALRQVYQAAGPYLDSLEDRPVHESGAARLLARLSDFADAGGLPDKGEGAVAAVHRLLGVGTATATHSAGPRFFHFVIGGGTPAALAADWTASMLDQNAGFRASSVLATETETVALRWLRELFGLPESYGGALVASATFANFTSLAAATHWWGEQHGVDVVANGLVGLPRMPVLSGGYVHASARKALQMLGHGRDSVEVFARDAVGRVDLAALEARLVSIGGPAVIIANAGEVNAGDFDPIDALADIAARHGAWLHVDGAFGLFAALSPRTAGLVAGVERADSIACDGHKWLNVPYESGFAFLRDPRRLATAFGMPGAPYLPGPDSPWGGYALLDLAQRLARRVDETPDLERLAEVPLCIVCFRARPAGVAEADLDDLNRRLGEALLDDGRVFAGSTVYGGRVALRPAIVNWRTTEADVDLLVDVVRELLGRLVSAANPP
jgi:glutamate/tyrosine decarboxylase-like PLP-dependent enzyme